MTVMNLERPKFNRRDYVALPEGFPAELIRGQLVKKPTPPPWHQVLVGRLLVLLDEVTDEKRILLSWIDLFVDDETILQPDVVVLPEGTRVGPATEEIPLPDLVVEVLTPSTRNRDRGVKTGIYLDAGVAEVWLVDPENQRIELMTPLGSVANPVSAVVPGFRPDPKELFRG